jgi:lipoate-protein ligase A
MRSLLCSSSNPYFNLATEDYFLKNSNEELFFIYINEPCIVVGKHQNLLSEINLQFVLNNNIKLVRRISGGGTVYQDFNNLNFSFIHNCPNPDKINFEKFTSPVLEALKDLGLDVEFSGRHDLLIESKKISGNAMHIFKSRVLSHGTLLFNSDLKLLSDALSNSPQKYLDKSIKSVRSKVTNIADYLSHPSSITTFTQNIFNNILSKSVNSYIEPLSDSEVAAIRQIATEKYETWDWIYGYSPKYLFHNGFHLPDLTLEFEFHVEKGIIRRINTNIDSRTHPIYHRVFETLVNVRHDFQTINEMLENNSFINLDPTFNISEFCLHLF